jgi:hypothetical protein
LKRLAEVEIARAAILKTWRQAIRLKYSLMADAEIAQRLPDVEDRINAAITSGEFLAIDVGEILSEA